MRYLFTTTILAVLCSLMAFKPAPRKTVFSMKKIEKKMALVKSGLFAAKHETTNLEYNEFLAFLEKKGDPSTLQIAKIQNETWSGFPTYGEPFRSQYAHHPAYENYPVVNISQQGASLFCEWLTEQYNAYPKRQYKKVRFRLPTEQEWLTAARAGNEYAIYPWGGNYLKNNDGQYLANFRRISESQQMRLREDGLMEVNNKGFSDNYVAAIPSPVESFYPNDFGIYNLSGNVAEMLSEQGRTRGGSWQSFGYYLRLDSEDEYAGFTEASPLIGFRYFMEVIE